MRKKEFIVSAVRYDATRHQVKRLKLHERMGAVLGAEYVLDKLSVLALLTGGYPVYTAFSDAAGTVKKGDPLHRVFSDENIFLSRNPRERARDDVGMLPEF